LPSRRHSTSTPSLPRCSPTPGRGLTPASDAEVLGRLACSRWHHHGAQQRQQLAPPRRCRRHLSPTGPPWPTARGRTRGCRRSCRANPPEEAAPLITDDVPSSLERTTTPRRRRIDTENVAAAARKEGRHPGKRSPPPSSLLGLRPAGPPTAARGRGAQRRWGAWAGGAVASRVA
jgi:hypothetical protein